MSCRKVIITAVVFFGTLVRAAGAGQSPGDQRQLAADHRRAARHGRGGASARRGSRHADPQSRRQRDRRGDCHVGGAGRGRARNDRSRRRHVRPLLQRQDRRGEVHQRHRLRARRRRRSTSTSRRAASRTKVRCRSRCPARSSGAAYAVKTYGTKPLAEVLAPAIEIADNGFPITEALAQGLQSGKAKLAKYPSSTKLWFKDGKPLAMGDIIRNPDLARTLRAIAAQGPDAFYKGDIAKNTAAFLKANGGIITEADLAAIAAVRGHAGPRQLPRRRGLRVSAKLAGLRDARGAQHPRGLQPEGDGAQQRRRICTPSPKRSSCRSPTATPTSAIRSSCRTSRCGQLLSKEYAAVRRAQIDPNRAIVGEPAPGDPRAMKPTTAGQAQVYGSPQARRRS